MTPQRATPGFRTRLLQVIGNTPPFAWAARVGIEKATFDGILNKGAIPTTKTLFKIAANSNVSLNWLLTGQGEPELTGFIGTQEASIAYAFPDYVMVPRYDIRTSAALPAAQSEQVVDHLAFKTEWVRRTMGLEPDQLALILVKGDSMEPTLKEDDMVLLDMRDQHVRNDALYVLRWENLLLVKRLQRGFDGTISIHSDNPVYHRQVIPEEKTSQLSILGRVVWTGRRM